MKYLFIPLSFLLHCAFSVAEEVPPADQSNLAKYVSVNIEIKELKESGKILRDASLNLSQALNTASENLDKLSPEQLTLMNSLADKMEHITDKLNQSVTHIPSTIKEAQTPASQLLQQSLDQVQASTITPIVSTLETWLIITIVGLCLLAIGLFVVSAYCMKQVGKLGTTIKEIADGYRVIPAEQYRKEMYELEISKEHD